MEIVFVLGPFGSGKSTSLPFFASCCSGPVHIFDIDASVQATASYQAVAANASRKALRHKYLELVRPVRDRCDAKLEEHLLGAGSAVVEDPGRNSRWAAWALAVLVTPIRQKFPDCRLRLNYLVVSERDGWARCRARAGPSIPEGEYRACRQTALENLKTLAPHCHDVRLWKSQKQGNPIPLPLPLPLGVLAPRSPRLRRSLEALCGGSRAYVTLVMLSDRYVPGALTLAQSLIRVRSVGERVCLVSPEVSQTARRALSQFYTFVTEVPLLEAETRRMPGARQRELYPASFCGAAFTKWRCLELVQYEKIVYVDADVVFQKNPDSLFALPSPAASFVNPWAPTAWYPGLEHGQEVPSRRIRQAFTATTSYVAYGSLAVLTPSAETFNRLRSILTQKPVYGQQLGSLSGLDELLLTETFVPARSSREPSVAWTHIDPIFHHIPWKKYPGTSPRKSLSSAIGIHYFGERKPWEMENENWTDLKIWDLLWKEVRELASDFSGTEWWPRRDGDRTPRPKLEI